MLVLFKLLHQLPLCLERKEHTNGEGRRKKEGLEQRRLMIMKDEDTAKPASALCPGSYGKPAEHMLCYAFIVFKRGLLPHPLNLSQLHLSVCFIPCWTNVFNGGKKSVEGSMMWKIPLIFGVTPELQVSGSNFFFLFAMIRSWAPFYTLATQPCAKWELQILHHSWLQMCRCGSVCRGVLQAHTAATWVQHLCTSQQHLGQKWRT